MTTPLDTLAPRVERLLTQYQSLEQSHRQLEQAHLEQEATLAAVTQERDSLRMRLQAARTRIDELIERLPVNQACAEAAATPNDQEPA